MEAQVAEAEFLLAQIMVELKMGLEELKIIMIHLQEIHGMQMVTIVEI